MTKPTLSVLMPNYNHAPFLPVALQSVLDQSHQPDEIIVLDDASTDNSVEVIERFAAQHPRIRFERNERNRGIMYNLGHMLGLAKSRFAFFMACDDMILPGFLEKSIALLAEHPEAGICTTLSRVIDKEGKDLGLLSGIVPSEGPVYITPGRARTLLSTVGQWMQGNTTIYRREALIEAGGFLPELHSFSDNFTSQVLALKHGACFIPEPLAAWRRMHGTYSVRCRSNPEVEQALIRNATTLMETRYRDVFPPGYADTWAREMAFELARMIQSRDPRREIGVGRDGATAGRGGAFGFVRTGAAAASSLLSLAYLLIRHRPTHAVRRGLLRVFPKRDLRIVRTPSGELQGSAR